MTATERRLSTLVADRALAPSSRRTVVEQITNDAHRRRAQIGRCARSDGLEKQVFDEVGRPALPPSDPRRREHRRAPDDADFLRVTGLTELPTRPPARQAADSRAETDGRRPIRTPLPLTAPASGETPCKPPNHIEPAVPAATGSGQARNGIT